ncbi:MAG: hypothetical protein ACOX0A_07155 [Thermoguttaceae bacterium]|jgi:hypothetical protein
MAEEARIACEPELIRPKPPTSLDEAERRRREDDETRKAFAPFLRRLLRRGASTPAIATRDKEG